jgi:hypothetical protein
MNPAVLEVLRKVAAKDPRYNVYLVSSSGTPMARRSLPCVHEGPVVEWCKTCTGPNAELRHVRQCLHPTADRDICTRGMIAASVQSCWTCPDYASPASGS